MNQENQNTPAAAETAESNTPAPAGDLSGLTGLGGAPTATPAPGDAPEVSTRPLAAAEPPDAHGWWWGTGRRKSAVARVRIKPGSGSFKIQTSRKNSKTIEEYFSELRDRVDVVSPLEVTGTQESMDVVVRADGGGYMGQAGAIKLAVARALKKYDPNFENVLREHGLLTRDAREVERKKYGQAGARRRFQFSKR